MLSEWFTIENIENLALHYRALGPFIGILFPFIEACLTIFTIGSICSSECKCLWAMVWFYCLIERL